MLNRNQGKINLVLELHLLVELEKKKHSDNAT